MTDTNPSVPAVAESVATRSLAALGDGDTLAFCNILTPEHCHLLPDSVFTQLAPLADIRYTGIQITHDLVADYAPRFSGNDSLLVYFSRLEREGTEDLGIYDIRYQSQICTVTIDRGEVGVISDGRASEFFPDISPDGTTIVCQRADGDTLKEKWTAAGGSYLYQYDVTTGAGGIIGDEKISGRCPRFTPGGDEVLFVTGQFGDEGAISSINPATGEVIARYRYPTLFKLRKPSAVFCVSLCADHSIMVFQAGLLGQQGIYWSDEFGRNIHRLTRNVRTWDDEAREQHPTVSPDGRHIVFVGRADEHDELFLYSVDGKVRRQLTDDGNDKAFPSYSPNGRYLAYSAKPAGAPDADFELYIIDLASKAARDQFAEYVAQLPQDMEQRRRRATGNRLFGE